jgi:hypothetical protein
VRLAGIALVVTVIAGAASCGTILNSTNEAPARADAAIDTLTDAATGSEAASSDAAQASDASTRYCTGRTDAFCSAFDSAPETEGWAAFPIRGAQANVRTVAPRTFLDITLPPPGEAGLVPGYRLQHVIQLGSSRSFTIQLDVNLIASSAPVLTLLAIQIGDDPQKTFTVTASDAATILTVVGPDPTGSSATSVIPAIRFPKTSGFG